MQIQYIYERGGMRHGTHIQIQYMYIRGDMSHGTYTSRTPHCIPQRITAIVTSNISMSHVTYIFGCHTEWKYESRDPHVTHPSSRIPTANFYLQRMSQVTHIDESCHGFGRVMSHTSMSHVTLTDESCPTHWWVMSHTLMSHVPLIDES